MLLFFGNEGLKMITDMKFEMPHLPEDPDNQVMAGSTGEPMITWNVIVVAIRASSR